MNMAAAVVLGYCVITLCFPFYVYAFVDPSGCLKAHNDKRALHVGTAPLVWDETLAQQAEQWAEHLQRTDQVTPSNLNERNGAGENLFFSFSPTVSTCAEVVEHWYSEVSNYPFDKPPTSIFGGKDGNVIGHFTQVVWKSTKKVGVARVSKRHSNGLSETYIVARYSPASHLRGQFTKEVGRLKST